MRKKVVLLLSFILALTLALGIMSACGKKKDDVTVTMRQTEITVEVGKTGIINATASNGAELVWESSNTAVATVNEKGRVTGVSAGTAKVTATVKDGKAKAECTVKVTEAVEITFKADGTAVAAGEKVEVEMRQTVQLSATVSDGGTISRWWSADEKIATVDEASGLVTGVIPGEVAIYVTTGAGKNAFVTVKVNAKDGYQVITQETKAPGEWWYYTSTADGRQTEVSEAFCEDGAVTFNFGGNGNWYIDDIQLGHIAPNGTTAGWKKLTGKITASDITTTAESAAYGVTIFDTMVPVVNGETNFSICFQQTTGGNDVFIRFAGNAALISGGSFTLSNLNWEDHTQETLVTPSFELNGKEVIVTDQTNDAYSVQAYQVGLFKADNLKTPVYAQNFDISGGELDTSTIETEEETVFIVKIMAVAQPGYVNSAWSASDDTTYTVPKQTVTYELASTGEDGTNATGRWTYWAGDGGSVSKAPTYENGTVTLESDNLGWAFYSTQLFRKYKEYSTGEDLMITMKINASHAGHITITGNVVELKEGDNDVEIYIQNPAGATISIQFGVNGASSPVDFGDGHKVFVISDVNVISFKPEALLVPGATFTKAEGDNPATINVTDEVNDAANVSKYEVGFFDATGKLIGTATIAEDGTFSDLAIKDDTYSLKVRAVSAKALYTASDWTEAITDNYVVENGGVQYNLKFGGDGDGATENGNAVTNPDNWYYWNDQNWTGSNVKINQAVYSRNTVTVSYTVENGASAIGVQLYFKNTQLNVGSVYKLTLNIHADEAVSVVINGTSFDLVKGDNNNLTVYYKEALGVGYSFSMQIAVNKDALSNNTVVLSGMTWTAYTPEKLNTPAIAVDGDKKVTITDDNDAAKLSGFEVGFFADGSEEPVFTANVTNGGTLNDSKLEAGTYTLKVRALALGIAASDSDWSAGISYTKTGGITYNTYDATYNLMDGCHAEGDAGANQWKFWWVQDASWNCGSVVTSNGATSDGSAITCTYSGGDNDWSVQLFYDNSDCVAGQKYKLTCTITVSAACTVNINGTQVSLNAGANSVEVEFVQGNRGDGAISSFDMQMGQKNTTGYTLTLSNVQWTELAA